MVCDEPEVRPRREGVPEERGGCDRGCRTGKVGARRAVGDELREEWCTKVRRRARVCGGEGLEEVENGCGFGFVQDKGRWGKRDLRISYG